jgi:CRISPR-associated endoribonuclease Cas6
VYIFRAVFKLLLLDSADLALFTGRLVKSLIMTLKGFEPLRRFYEGFGLKPFRATPLLHCSTGALARGRVEAGEALCFEVSYASQDISGVQSLASVDEDVKVFSSRARVEAKNIEIVTADTLTIGFRNPQDQVIKIVFETPTLLSVKLMTPPVPEIQKRLAKAKTLYMLFPSPAHICSYLVKLWNTAFPTTPLVPLYSPEWAPYLFGRLCEATMAPIDYSIKPTTIAYDERRRIRGFTGWTIIDTTPIGRKHIERIDKLMALANYLGLGKSRGIGFGKVRATAIERKRS